MKTRKISLKRETLRQLDDNSLRNLLGGAVSNGSGSGFTCICVVNQQPTLIGAVGQPKTAASTPGQNLTADCI